jgi:hypothetical protein
MRSFNLSFKCQHVNLSPNMIHFTAKIASLGLIEKKVACMVRCVESIEVKSKVSDRELSL